MTYKTYFINQRTEDTVSSGEKPGGFRFLMYDYLNEFDMIPLDISQEAMTATVEFTCPKVITGSIEITGDSSNTFYGKSSGVSLTTGISNVFFGYESGKSISAGNYNVGVGRNAAQLITTGTNNTIIGNQAGTALTTGRTNTILGSKAGTQITTNNGNTIIGYETASTTSEFSDGCYIGNSVVATASATNEIVIGSTASGQGSNTVTIGNDSIENIYLKGNVSCPGEIITEQLNVGGTIYSTTINTDALFIGTTNVGDTLTSLTGGGGTTAPTSLGTGTTGSDLTLTSLKTDSLFAKYLLLGETGSEPTSEFADLINPSGNGGGTWVDYNRDNMTYKTYFINQRKSSTTTSGEIPGGFRFMTYDSNNEAMAYPLDIMHDTITSNVKFSSEEAYLGKITVGGGDTTNIAKLMMKSFNSTVPTYDTLIQSEKHATATTNGQGTLTFKALKNTFEGELESKSNITLPTTLTTPTAGQLGYTITGTFNPDSKLTARLSPCSGYLSKLVLPVGVWLIQATAGVLCTAGGNNMNPFSIQISAVQNTGADSAAGSAVALNLATTYSTINYNNINTNGWNTVDTTSIVTVTAATTYYLNFYLAFTGGATAYTVNTATNNPFSFKAVRIA